MADIIRDGTLIRRVKVGLRRYASLYQVGGRFYVTEDRLIEFNTCKNRAVQYLESIKADV